MYSRRSCRASGSGCTYGAWDTGPLDHPLDQECTVQQGTVRWYDLERGFGFLAPDDGSADIFVHVSQVRGEGAAQALREGQTVEFEPGEGSRGPQALHVAVTGDVAPAAALGML